MRRGLRTACYYAKNPTGRPEGSLDAPRPTPIKRSRRKGKKFHKGKKFYVVWQGRNPGIYLTWADCKEEVDCYSGARYRSYRTLSEAKAAFHAEPSLQA